MFGPLLDQTLVDRTLSTLVTAPRVVLVTHKHPDGDALGSTLALKLALEQLGRPVSAVCRDSAPHVFRFLPGVESIERELTLRTGDLVVTLDCGDLSRTGFPEIIRSIAGPRGRVINVDHHQRNDLFKLATVNLVSHDASSAAELVYELVGRLPVHLTKQIATSILAGIYNDTGGFRHSNTTPRVLEIASILLRSGGRLREITRHVANFRSVPSLRLWGVALERIRFNAVLGVVSSAITQSDLQRSSALLEDLAGAVNLINHVPEARVALLCAETADGQIKASLRTERNEIDVARLANLFGGGGLKKAAGFSIRGRIAVDTQGSWRVVTEQLGDPAPSVLTFESLKTALRETVAAR